jgi:uncharacterized protein (TIGR02118 family)
VTRRKILKSVGIGLVAGAGVTGLVPALTSAAEVSATATKAKIVVVLFRKGDLSHEQCLAEWSGEPHTSIVRAVPGLRKWVQNHVIPTSAEAPPDGIGELWFDSPEAMAETMKSPQMAAAFEDAQRFLDLKRTYALVVEERMVIA